MQQHDNCREAHLEFEANADVNDEQDERDPECQKRLIDNARAPVGTDGRNLEVVGSQTELVGDVGGNGGGLLRVLFVL